MANTVHLFNKRGYSNTKGLSLFLVHPVAYIVIVPTNPPTASDGKATCESKQLMLSI